MANTILITANWHTGALSQQTISRQYDNNRYVVQFVGYPEASEGNELDYYLLVWMSSAPGEKPDEIAPIQLASDQWYVSNVFTQQTQQIKFQMCALNTEGTFEAHSPIFTGFVRNSLEHDGTTQDIDVSTLFDAYREYLNELIIRSGAVVIDSVPTQGSTNAVSSGGVYDALGTLQAQIPQIDIDSTLSQSGQAADAKVTGDALSGKVDAEAGKGLSTNDYTDADKLKLTDAASKIDGIDNDMYGRTSVLLENGTIQTATNQNAVRTVSGIPCAYGDTVEFFPVRPNISGYHYEYGYRTYDSIGNTLTNKGTANSTQNKLTISDVNAASIKFFVVEISGSTYNPLRYDTYGYTPYVTVNEADTVVGGITAIKNELLNIRTEDSFFANASWEQGLLDNGREGESTTRIRTGFIRPGLFEEIAFSVVSGYNYTFAYYAEDKSWITSESNWINTEIILSASDLPPSCEFIRAVLKKSSGNIVPSEGTNVSGKIRRVAKHATNYLLNKINSEETEKYDNLLSQARFSPTSNAHVLTLLHFSDVHANLSAMEKAIDLMETFSDKIDDAIHTGDVVLANFSNGITNWVSSGCAERVISVIGNHDSEENLVLGTAGKTNVYNALLAPYISNWDVVQPDGVSDSSSGNYCACYYYKDYTTPKIRLIVLDTNWWDNYQKTWLADVLGDALISGYAVILACHTPRYVTGVTSANFCSYTEPTISESASYTNIPDDWLEPVDDFIDGGGEVICMLSGHNHRDHFGYLTLFPDVLCLTADKASVARTIDTARIAGTSNAYAFNFVTVNTTNKWIKIVRYGSEVDGQMRGKHVFCYDYANKRIISQW